MNPDNLPTIKSFFCGLCIFCFAYSGCCCLWVAGTTIEGEHSSYSGFSRGEYLAKILEETPKTRLARLQRTRIEPRDEVSDELIGVTMVLNGEYSDAINVFQQIEENTPGRYTTAANLGTAYELNGQLEDALKWVSEGINRNPDSHLGTEWLHVEIIKSLIRLRDDPDYFESNHILEIPEIVSKDWLLKIGGNEFTLTEVMAALDYQLKERMIFIKPPDPVVADLLYSYGLLEARTRIVETGIPLLKLSLQYGFSDLSSIENEISNYESLIQKRLFRRNVYICIGSFALLILAYFAIKNKWITLRRHSAS